MSDDNPHLDDNADNFKLDEQVRALRKDVAGLRDLLQAGPPPRPRLAAKQVVSTPEQERIARRLRDQLIQREDELKDLRRDLLTSERNLDQSETQRRKMLKSRTWQWGKTVARIGMAPLNFAKSVYSWVLSVLPAPANQALRQAVAKTRGGRGITTKAVGVTRGGNTASLGRKQALVPIPVHGPEGVGAALTAPAVLLVGYGLDEAALREIVDHLADMRRTLTDGMRVLLVTDCDAFHVFRAHSLLFEYIPPRSEWERHDFAQSYDSFRAARFDELFRIYAPDRVVHIQGVDDLLGMPASLFVTP